MNTTPHSIEAEEHLLGSLVLDPRKITTVAALLQPDDFYIHRNRWWYDVMIGLDKAGRPVDPITITEELDKLGRLEEFGGIAHFTGIVNNSFDSFNVEEYAKIVRETSTRRRLIDAAQEIVKMGYSESVPIDKALSVCSNAISDVLEHANTGSEGLLIKDGMSRQFDRMEKASKGEVEIAVPLGYLDVDKILSGGPRNGDLVLVAGRPGMGKTSFMVDVAGNMCERGKSGAIFSLEMPDDQVVDRLVAREGISTHNIRQGKLADDEYAVYTHAIEKIPTWKLVIDDTPGMSVEQLRAKVARYKSLYDLDFAVIDYIQLMEAHGMDNRVQAISHISRRLKLIAREFDIPVIAGSQLSRAVEQRGDKRPILSDLRDSGTLEQDADIVIFLYRPEVYSDNADNINIAEVNVAKHRNGPIGTAQLIFRKQFTRFDNAEIRKVNLNSMYPTKQPF